ncbi:MAG: hypothetical protein CL840_09270 [Crocinitomicaceae bacterium]|nr:hypothetical protein [Crocinitomicaceae bacterium]
MTRSYHNINAKYNGYFNAKEEYKKGVLKVENGHKENYRELLPLFVIGDKEMAKSVQTEMDVVIKKSSRVIQFHSMNIKGKEYCKWIDDTWILIGKAYFYEKNWGECRPIFEYVAKKYKKSELKIEARIWLVRTLLEQENYDRAEVVLKSLENNSKIPDEYLPFYKAVSAQYHIALEDYPKAIIDLEDATRFEKDKERLTRWLFVLAQLYAMQGETIRANRTYQIVVKKHPDYEMEFWAQIHRALSYTNADGSSYDIKKTLLKMLRDDKNKEYRDKLYYALSKIYRQEDREDKQIKALKLSAKVSVEDDYQKGLSFLTLGQIYFSKPEYKPAQAYYDSAVVYLPDDFPNRKHIINIQTSLKDLVDQIVIIETQDSLQGLADLSEEELMALVEEVIDERLAEEERKREALEGGGNLSQTTDRGFDDGSEKGKWYFYNERNIKIGQQEFKQIWGSRANEDNWRRSDRSTDSEDDLASFNTDATDSTISGIKDVDSYLKDIPRTKEARSESDQKIINAYYKLGNIYKENMNDDARAIGSFRMLVSRFDSSQHHLSSYYLLYRLYYSENRIDSSNYFKNYVLYKYPNSDYAKIIRDPNYALEMSNEKKAIERRYKKAYYYYDRGFYKACIDYVDESEKKYPKNYLSNKFQYLKALSVGSQGDKEQLVASLKKFSGEYGGTPEAKDAQNRVKILTTKKAIIEKKEAPKYVYERNARHLVLLMVPVDGNNIEEIKKSMDNYNKAYHVGKGINISSVLLNKKMHMVSIKQFGSESKAKDYFSAFSGNQTSLKKINASNFDLLIISYTNYALFFQDKRIDVYQEFMKTNYQL